MSADTVHRDQLVSLHGAASPIPSRWSYRAGEPFTVMVAFQTARGRWVEWAFDRELLITGLREPAGIGDVRFRPVEPSGHADDMPRTIMEIESPDGYAVFELDSDSLADFLEATAELVPFGAESGAFDVDALIAELSRTSTNG